jgi:hypothetical protein
MTVILQISKEQVATVSVADWAASAAANLATGEERGVRSEDRETGCALERIRLTGFWQGKSTMAKKKVDGRARETTGT